MGVCKVDISKNDQVLDKYDYSTEKGVAGIISNYYSIKTISEFDGNISAVILIADIDIALGKAKKLLSEHQMNLLKLLSEGYSYSDIAVKLGLDRSNVRKSVLNACKKISAILEPQNSK